MLGVSFSNQSRLLRALLPPCIGLLGLLPVAATAEGEPDAVRAMYEEFREAMRLDDGEAAVELMSARSLAYFERVKQLALEADQAEVKALPAYEQYHVVVFRQMLSRAELEPAPPRLIATWFINEGWLGAGHYVLADLKEVAVTGDWATAKISVRGELLPFDYQFWKEDGRWRIDLTTTHKAASRSLLDMADKSKLSPEQMIGQLVERGSGRPVDSRVWQPMLSWSAE